MNLELKPCGDRVVVKRTEPDAYKILLPDVYLENQRDHREGEILAVGTGKFYRKARRRIPLHGLAIGDRVLFSKWAGSPMKIDGQDVVVMQMTDVLAVVEE